MNNTEMFIVNKYKNNGLLNEIAEFYNLEIIEVEEILLKYNVKLRFKDKSKVALEIRKEIIKLFNEGNSGLEIHKKLKEKVKIGKNTVFRILKKYGLEASKNCFNEETELLIVKEYLEGKPSSELAEKYGCDRVTVLNILKRHGVERRSRGNTPKEFSEYEYAVVTEMWLNGFSRKAITEKLNIAGHLVDRCLKELGFVLENRFLTGENHPQWKGGRIINGHGYVNILLNSSDLFYSMANTSGYVLEHRYVMAKHLGRPLTNNETVHHIDGDKTNNNINNLELRQGKHQPGISCQCTECGSKNIITIQLQRNDYTNSECERLPNEIKLFSEEKQKEILKKYESGSSISKIAREENTTRQYIKKILKKLGAKRDSSLQWKLEKYKEEFINKWNNGDSNEEIKNYFNISGPTLNRWVKKLKLPLRRNSAFGKNNGHWIDGKRHLKSGYTGIYLNKDDPFYCMINGEGYVMEHRYVMAKHLGRPLTDDEKIHHIDGNKSNNSIENLQLVQKHHGKGQVYQCVDCKSNNIKQIPLN